jgi:hypothetical protein
MTLGQVGYEAHCSSLDWKSASGEPLPVWDDASANIKIAWEYAAEIIREAVGGRRIREKGDY